MKEAGNLIKRVDELEAYAKQQSAEQQKRIKELQKNECITK